MNAPRLLALAALLALANPAGAQGGEPMIVGVTLPDASTLVREIPALRRLGASAVRIPVPWRDFEPRPGRADYAGIRLAVDAAVEAGMRPILVLRAIHPRLTRHRQRPRKTRGVSTAPFRYGEYAAAVGALASALAGRGVVYEIEEAPMDAARWWSGRRDYLRLLSTCHPAIKAADPDALVLCAAPPCGAVADRVSRRDRFEHLRRHAKHYRMLAGAWRVFRDGDPAALVPPLPLPSPARLSALLRPHFNRVWSFPAHDDWLRAVARTGAFDAVAIQNEYLPGEETVDGVSFAAYLQHVRRLLDEEGSDRPIWITRAVFPAMPAERLPGAHPADPASADLQEEWLREALLQAAAAGVAAFVWTDLRDRQEGDDPPHGLLGAGDSPRPAHETLAFFARNAARFAPAPR